MNMSFDRRRRARKGIKWYCCSCRVIFGKCNYYKIMWLFSLSMHFYVIRNMLILWSSIIILCVDYLDVWILKIIARNCILNSCENIPIRSIKTVAILWTLQCYWWQSLHNYGNSMDSYLFSYLACRYIESAYLSESTCRHADTCYLWQDSPEIPIHRHSPLWTS